VSAVAAARAVTSTPVPDHKAVVEQYFDGFRTSDHEKILACLTDDVVWDLVGYVHLSGKAAFDNEIENEQFVGLPTLNVDRLVEEGATVVALGDGQGAHVSGNVHRFSFVTVFTFVGDLVGRVESWVIPLT